MTTTHTSTGIEDCAAGFETADLDTAQVEEFAGTVLQIIADASAALVLSIGHRTGLFDGMADLPPSSSQQVADATGLQERYVREWLAAMLVAGIVEFDVSTDTWWLPPEHAAVLTRRAGKDNLAKLAQLIGLMAGVEQQVVTCFREGGGVPYSAYTEFDALMAEDSKDTAEALLVKEVVPLVDGLAHRLSAGIRVADIGCGSGHHLNVLAAAYPASSFVGYDLSEEAITTARSTAESRGLTNVGFEVRDVSDLSHTGAFDLITAFDAIHDQAHPAQVLAGIVASLAPDGVFLMCDIRASSHPDENVGVPGAGFVYGISLMHCMTVSLSHPGGVGLGAGWGEQTAVRMLREAGFAEVEVKSLDGDIINTYYIARSGS